MKFSKFITRKFDNTFFEKQINHIFREVNDDIKILKDEIYQNNPNPFVNYIYEEYELGPIVKNMIKKKYKEHYCPSSLFDYFNQSEKANYIMLRLEIDKLLDINDTSYEI